MEFFGEKQMTRTKIIFFLSFFWQAEGVPQPLKRGGCTVHTGRTLHYTGGNRTGLARRAYIVNFRPASMIDVERKNDYDHGKAGFKASKKGQIHNADERK